MTHNNSQSHAIAVLDLGSRSVSSHLDQTQVWIKLLKCLCQVKFLLFLKTYEMIVTNYYKLHTQHTVYRTCNDETQIESLNSHSYFKNNNNNRNSRHTATTGPQQFWNPAWHKSPTSRLGPKIVPGKWFFAALGSTHLGFWVYLWGHLFPIRNSLCLHLRNIL